MKKIFLALISAIMSIFALFGCARHKITTTKSEHLILAAFGAQERLYIITDAGEYEFGKRALDSFIYMQNLISRHSSHMSHVRTLITIDKTIKNGGYTRIFHTLRLDASKLTAVEIESFKAHRSSFFEFELQDDGAYFITFFDFTGKAVKLANRNEIIRKYAFSVPVPLEISVLNRSFDLGASADDVLASATMPIFVPIEAVKILGLIISDSMPKDKKRD